MARPSAEAKVVVAAIAYLEEAKRLPAAVKPINYVDIGEAIGYHRHTVAKHISKETLQAALDEQARWEAAEVTQVRTEADDRVAQLEAEARNYAKRIHALTAQVAVAEGNAQRLGIDPAELYKPLDAPPRTAPWDRPRGDA